MSALIKIDTVPEGCENCPFHIVGLTSDVIDSLLQKRTHGNED